MADTNNARQKEIKVEDLLQLKRAERPDDAFWDTFDRELHQRMLQTLVKKDPWYVQMLRGVSGRIAQTTAVGAAAAFLAMMVVRPALVDSIQPALETPYVQQQMDTLDAFGVSRDSVSSAAPVEVAMSDFENDFENDFDRDYHMDSVSATSGSELGYVREYAHDTIEVASYDRVAYATDTAVFASSSIATGLVY